MVQNYFLIYFFYSVIFPFLRVSSPFDSLDCGLTPVRVTASYSNEGLVAATIHLLLRTMAGYQLKVFRE